jgi:hypothetical protein
VTDRGGDTSIDPRVLVSGRCQDVCPDCGTTVVGSRLDDVLGAACACQARRTYRYLTELVCVLCSRAVAKAVSAQPKASIWVPRQLRCGHWWRSTIGRRNRPQSHLSQRPPSLGRRANVPNVHPHRFRHDTTRRLVESVDLPTVAAWLGHGRLDTVRIYSQPDEAALERAVTALEDR